MPVDMLLSRYFEELEKALGNQPFRREGQADSEMLRAPLPPYRHIFHGLCLIEHSRGYRLPRYQSFRTVYISALQRHHRYKEAQAKFFLDNGDPHPALLNRIGGWYLDGLTHTHLYCALVQAFEEQRRIGAVLMDARADVKLKADLLIVLPNKVARVSIEAGTGPSQQELMARRAAAEEQAKANNQTSSQNENPLHEEVFTVTIARNATEPFKNYGVNLFHGMAIDDLINRLDTFLGILKSHAITYDQMKNVTMKDLQQKGTSGGLPRLDSSAG